MRRRGWNRSVDAGAEAVTLWPAATLLPPRLANSAAVGGVVVVDGGGTGARGAVSAGDGLGGTAANGWNGGRVTPRVLDDAAAAATPFHTVMDAAGNEKQEAGLTRAQNAAAFSTRTTGSAVTKP